ncbi:hypothetical protein [Cellulomonas persica]|uniref:Uncharacterized protein n=1 Tax=Cellulomonas persica TaxID=76861 RepID=A0A510UQF2_9CELL|nr:hypothetical protein [Cellulomonas persica]GEK16799.1 hypothetical protein CPE01_05320 [Cellulomonas persica]
MRRLFWIGVGVALTVVVVRNGRRIAEAYLPEGTTDVVDGATRLTRAVATARSQFAAGFAEREAELRHQLVGDADVDELRAQRSRHVEELRESFGSRRARPGRAAPSDWAGPLDDPDDDGEAAFF